MADSVDDAREKIRKTYSEFGVKVGLERKGDKRHSTPKRIQPKTQPRNVMPEERLTYNVAGSTNTTLEELPETKRVRATGLVKSAQRLVKILNFEGPYIEVHPSGRTDTVTVQAELRLDKFRKPFAWARWTLFGHEGYSIVLRWWGHKFWILSLVKEIPETVIIETATFRDEWGKLVPTPTNVAHAIKKTVRGWLDKA